MTAAHNLTKEIDMPKSTAKATKGAHVTVVDAPKRQRKTPEQRAVEALEAARRRVTKAEEKVTSTHGEYEAAQAELSEARRRLSYVATDPALPADPESEDDGEEGA